MELWGHPAYFDYVDRWIQEEVPEGKDFYSYGPDPIKAMWLTYRSQADALGQAFRARRETTGDLGEE